ncbi:hypothetical protein GC093_03975 [Paenibacillus sp. LMG 31456]|uniref:Spore germination protein n=1 Tax=Paenibacillus foliorum TaxID=2654974 RepID=A0A972JZ54_9BACL|nr:hypothetical protein [Paenibacillus foliorum]
MMIKSPIPCKRDGFTETLRINTSLVRRRIRSARLKLEPLVIGELSQTDVVILYIEGIAKSTMIEEVRKRLSCNQIDAEIGEISAIEKE